MKQCIQSLILQSRYISNKYWKATGSSCKLCLAIYLFLREASSKVCYRRPTEGMKHVNYSTRAHFVGHWQCSYSLHVAHKSCSPLPGFVFTTIFTTSLKVSRGQCCPDMLSNGDYTGCPPTVSTRKV